MTPSKYSQGFRLLDHNSVDNQNRTLMLRHVIVPCYRAAVYSPSPQNPTPASQTMRTYLKRYPVRRRHRRGLHLAVCEGRPPPV